MASVQHVAVIGGGIMGSGIGQVLLQHGYEVTIRDVDESILDEARDRIEHGNYGLDRAVDGGYLTESEREKALDRLTLTLDLEETVVDADAVIEAVSEDLSLKGRVFGELDELTESIPLFSNTSGFPITAIANAVDDPSRVAGMHFFNPPQVMNLVEIVETDQTADDVVEVAESVADDLEKTSITIDDAPDEYGFVANRAFFQGLVREAERIVDDGIATKEQVDTALEEGFNLPVGPFKYTGLGEEWD